MAVTQDDFVQQMLAQLRVLDPSISAEVGTPERKIIDTVSEALAESQIDIQLLQGGLDLTGKVGANLDQFLTLFGFARQQATFAEGFVVISRPTTTDTIIRIPTGTTLQSNVGAQIDAVDVGVKMFKTTIDGFINPGESSVTLPVVAQTQGLSGNAAANEVTIFAGTPVFGITTVTNPLPITGGLDVEDDDELKIRFQNTVFRNLAGTEDQYLALAVALQTVRRANIVGPVSRFREYIQIPPLPDTAAYNVDPSQTDTSEETGDPSTLGYTDPDTGDALTKAESNEYTTALSSVPYAKKTWTNIPCFVSSSQLGINQIYYREATDYRLNTSVDDRCRGDALRFSLASGADNQPLDLDPRSDLADAKPNITFTNVYQGNDPDVIQARPQDTILFEHSYLSNASRNDADHNVMNCVDAYIDGVDATQAVVTIPVPAQLGDASTAPNIFNQNSTSWLFFQKYRRFGEPYRPPVVGNWFVNFYWQPVIDLPDTITVTGVLGDDTQQTNTYYRGTHYWLVEDVSDIRGTVRARNGIEWNLTLPGWLSGDNLTGPYSGSTISSYKSYDPNNIDDSATTITVDSYVYDKSVSDYQIALEGAKQVTTDILAHRAKTRYFKFDVSIMTNPSNFASDSDVLHDALETFLGNITFGNPIQLSDILQAIHAVSFVDNVRWSSDIPGNAIEDRVFECDRLGQKLTYPLLDQYDQQNTQRLVIGGHPTAGYFTLKQGDAESKHIPFDVDSATLQSILLAPPIVYACTVIGNGTAESPFIITPTATTTLTVGVSTLTGGPNVFSSDFFLQDDEIAALPEFTVDGDTAPGLIVRNRVQNTFIRGG